MPGSTNPVQSLRPALRLSGHRYSPELLCRLVTLAGQLPSAACVATAVATLVAVSITGRHVQRLTQEVGTDLARFIPALFNPGAMRKLYT